MWIICIIQIIRITDDFSDYTDYTSDFTDYTFWDYMDYTRDFFPLKCVISLQLLEYHGTIPVSVPKGSHTISGRHPRDTERGVAF